MTTAARKRSIGRYRLVTPLGKGVQSDVWVAFDESLGKSVALKIMSADRATPAAREAFEREGALARMLTSPHTVRVLDVGTEPDGTCFLAMEHLVGCDLAQLVKQFGPLPPARVIHFGVGACHSLEEAHGHDLVHRDVKPGNLFASRVGAEHDVVKLLDFGIARTLAEASAARVGGTPAYLAPECCGGLPATHAADIYALGATLYHLLTGAPPFVGDTPDVIARQREEGAARPSVRLGAALPADLEDLVMRCLAKPAQLRPQSARDLRIALESCEQAGAWTQAEAAKFWDDDHRRAITRWTDDTHT